MGIRLRVESERIFDLGGYRDAVCLPGFFLADVEEILRGEVRLEQVAHLERQEVGDAECRIDAEFEEEQISDFILAPEDVFYLGDLFQVAYRLDELHWIY